ncbi:MAG: UDP-2,3-diacylglucosamine diphosphatase [Candidatus Coatesbacteria bacterium]|nr:UDP-2,3-diacylglucosamine diphosphatase [Candidatus Coatesbacteria bacterium]
MIYFLSDFHWGASWKNVDHELRSGMIIQFLRKIKKDATQLYLAGDTFDFWFEYKNAVPKKGLDLIFLLKEMESNGCKIIILDGNHDFAINGFLTNSGFLVEKGPLAISLNGYKIYVSHGDELMSDDIGYQILKKILRSRIISFVFSLIHPDAGLYGAYIFSGISRTYTEQKKPGIRFFKNLEDLSENGYEIFLLGHYHNPVYEKIGNSSHYFSLGDWIKNFSFVSFDGLNLIQQIAYIENEMLKFRELKKVILEKKENNVQEI